MERLSNSEEDRVASLLIVQELAAKYDDQHQIANNFIYKLDDYPQPMDSSVPYMEDVFIDLNLLSSNSSEELDKLRSALVFNGCFQLINHGMSTSYLDEIRQLSKQFFALPMEEKMKYAREKGGIEGYGDEQLVVNNQMLDWNDALSLRIYPEHERTLKYWPENPCNFRKMLHDYGERMKNLCEVLVKTMARLLGVEENVFLKRYGEKVEMNVRFNFYPLCPIPESVLGLKPHADFSTMTIILQDKVEGLQVMKDGQWFKVPVIPSTLFVNLGDAMEVTTIIWIYGPFEEEMEGFGKSEEDRSASLVIVQELAAKCDDQHQIPGGFIYKLGGYPQPIDSSVPYMEDVFIVFNLLSSASSEESDKLCSALVSNGCFQLINHGMSASFLDEIRQLSKQFFALPMEEKIKCGREKGGIEGYGDEQSAVSGQTIGTMDCHFVCIQNMNGLPNIGLKIPAISRRCFVIMVKG